MIRGVFIIGGQDYSRFVKYKTGLTWTRENTNDADAGRDLKETMHTNVTSHQRTLNVKMGPMTLEECMELESLLQGNDNGVLVTYPDLRDGICTRMFYNTNINAGVEQFSEDGVIIDNISFTLITVKEDMYENPTI